MKISPQNALAVLKEFIAIGIEFPDASYKAAAGTGYSIQELRELYDEDQCSKQHLPNEDGESPALFVWAGFEQGDTLAELEENHFNASGRF